MEGIGSMSIGTLIVLALGLIVLLIAGTGVVQAWEDAEGSFDFWDDKEENIKSETCEFDSNQLGCDLEGSEGQDGSGSGEGSGSGDESSPGFGGEELNEETGGGLAEIF